MVFCRSCGRNITSGTIRCSSCSAPYHLSCSHRYKITSEGVFNVCCGDGNDSVFPGSSAGYQMRTRGQNKRRQHYHPHQQQNSSFFVDSNNSLNNSGGGGIASMRYGKVQKIERNNMGIQQKQQQNEEPNDYNNTQVHI